MSCLSLPTVPPITLPGGLSLAPIGATVDFGGVDYCCTFKIPLPPIPINLPPGTFNPAIMATINQLIEGAVAVLNSVKVPSCPKE